MSGLSTEIRSEGVDEAIAVLGRVLGRFVDRTPLMARLAEFMAGAMQEHFELGAGPDGQAWKPSIRAQLGGGQTLVKSGLLRDRIVPAHTADQAEAGTNDIRARILHFGGIIRAKTAKALAFRMPGANGMRLVKQVTIPGRPFIGLSLANQVELGHQADDYVAEVLP